MIEALLITVSIVGVITPIVTQIFTIVVMFLLSDLQTTVSYLNNLDRDTYKNPFTDGDIEIASRRLQHLPHWLAKRVFSSALRRVTGGGYQHRDNVERFISKHQYQRSVK